MAEPLDDANDGLSCVGEQRVVVAGDEQGDLQKILQQVTEAATFNSIESIFPNTNSVSQDGTRLGNSNIRVSATSTSM